MIGSKATQSSEQFMNRTGNHSTKPSAKGFSLLGGGENPVSLLTPDEQRASLFAARMAIEGRIGKLTSALKGNKITHDERQQIAAKRRRLKDELIEVTEKQQILVASIRGSGPKKMELSHFIADIVKERMTVPQWNAILTEAKQRYAAQES